MAYFIAERLVTERVIERANLSCPDPNADGTIDYYKEKLGQYDSLFGADFADIDMVKDYLKDWYTTTAKEDLLKITNKDTGEIHFIKEGYYSSTN